MTSPRERTFGGHKQYDVVPRASDESDQGWAFYFTEKFYESRHKEFDAILLLGATLNHYTGNMNNILSFLYGGFSKKARAISRLFIKSLVVTYSIPSFENLELALDYTGRNSTVGTVDHTPDAMPDMSSEGVLGELRTINGYAFKVFDVLQETAAGVFTLEEFSGYRNWTHMCLSPKKYEYDYLETCFPLSFYVQSINFDTEKPVWVFWKIVAGVRFMGSEKSNPRFSKGISFGGTPG